MKKEIDFSHKYDHFILNFNDFEKLIYLDFYAVKNLLRGKSFLL